MATVSNRAFTQFRSHLRHTAWIELNQTAIVVVYYQDDDYQCYQEFCLLAINGAKIYLPDHRSLAKLFGTFDFPARKIDKVIGTQVQAILL